MSKLAFIPGILLTSVLICLLALSRLDTYEEKDLKVFDIEVVEIPEPPAPEFTEPEEEQSENLPPPPTPDIEIVDTLENIDRPEITLSPLTVSIDTPVDIFRETSDVADLPPPPKPVVKKSPPKKKYHPVTTSQKSPPKKKYTPPAPKKPTKSQYNIGELDSAPKLVRTGRFSWPRSAQGTEGKVVMKLKITKSGKVEVISVLSSSNSSLNSSAMKVAKGTRFTPPRKHGQVVEAIYTKTFYLKKP